jgi:phenylalanyl-tRNA synthetase alpha chain
LKELGSAVPQRDLTFARVAERDAAFQSLADELTRRGRERLEQFRSRSLRPRVCRLEGRLTEMLTRKGFVQVNTPLIMARSHLARMSITSDHPLFKQVYWIDRNHCLRPMLAPHLYSLLQNLLRLWEKPVRLFEVGPCFRKETGGARHGREFTMLNLVEAGLPMDERESRLKELTAWIAESTGLTDYRIAATRSEVYGDAIDILAGERQLEVGSGAIGPHPLDRAWRITDTWVGIGFGLERLLMASAGIDSLAKIGRSLSYLDGIRLNI